MTNMISNSDNETNFPHKLSVTNRQVANVHTFLQIIYLLKLSHHKLDNYQK